MTIMARGPDAIGFGSREPSSMPCAAPRARAAARRGGEHPRTAQAPLALMSAVAEYRGCLPLDKVTG